MIKQKKILITGAAKRIGKTIAQHFSALGYEVIIHYNKSKNDAEKLQKEITELGGIAYTVSCPLENHEELSNLVQNINEMHGTINVLVNNASSYEIDNFKTATHHNFHQQMDINFFGNTILCREFAKQNIKNEELNIINIIDYAVLNPDGSKFFSYMMAKTCMLQLTVMLAKELAPRIRVNAIGPGPVLQNIHQRQEHFDKLWKRTPLCRPVDFTEIAKTIEFLVSTPSITGQMLLLDSGLHLQGAIYD